MSARANIGPILIVEDDRDIRENLQEILEGEGFSVLTASHGGVALEYLRQAQVLPKLILLDLMMPVKDGFAFRKDQECDPKLANIPVVIMTADAHIDEKAIRIGAKTSIRKPIDIDTLLITVERHIR